MIQHAQQYEFFVEACLHFSKSKNHPFRLKIEKEEQDDASKGISQEQLEVRSCVCRCLLHQPHSPESHQALRKKEKEDAQARAAEAARSSVMISSSQIQGELRMDPGSISLDGNVCR